MEPASIMWMMCFVIKSQNPDRDRDFIEAAAHMAVGSLVSKERQEWAREFERELTIDELEKLVIHEVKKLFILEASKSVYMEEFNDLKFLHYKDI
jgi:hypothetical protein